MCLPINYWKNQGMFYYGLGPVKEHQLKQQVVPRMSKATHTSGAFSDKMTCEQLAVWLSHHTYMVGTDYLVDVEKLKGNSCIWYMTTAYKYNTLSFTQWQG